MATLSTASLSLYFFLSIYIILTHTPIYIYAVIEWLNMQRKKNNPLHGNLANIVET